MAKQKIKYKKVTKIRKKKQRTRCKSCGKFK